MTRLGVVGNISRDAAEHPEHQHHLLGGAALYIALAAVRAAVTAAPVSVIGHDLAKELQRPEPARLDLSRIAIVDQPSCRFHLTYDQQGTLTSVEASYGAAEQLTAHALEHLNGFEHVHVCCRRPLDPVPVLAALAEREQDFSVDFITASAADMIAATARFLPHARVVFADVSEYATLAHLVNLEDLRTVTVTDGPRPASLYRRGRLAARATVQPSPALEVTGAGDTFTGTFLARVLNGVPEELSLHHGAQAATSRVANLGITLHPQPP
ncbi:carbohydrate kinase family protein [Paractinoplanes lichenicola]|uniref:Carbohydrate kinase family protein n=1 Tax=Paractinoplanes lichenicola TaxID=2802976 RepID=A0ABS1W4J4_9ACTN|nr:carbohydrate kinase family protein [Actinoplanes lichenicola]MBL7261597.1 carbohydrate kinase family protein [Actinoplanes lichenicola]